MRILNETNNNRFYIANNHLFYYDHECMIYLGEERELEYWEDKKIKMYETGALFTEYYGYEKISNIAFFGNDGKCLFSINTNKMPFDINLYKSKADNIHALIFNNGVLVSMRNIDNQSKYIFYFYDKTFITGYDFNLLMEKVQKLSKTKEYTDMILNCLESKDNLSQEL